MRNLNPELDSERALDSDVVGRDSVSSPLSNNYFRDQNENETTRKLKSQFSKVTPD